MRASLVSLVLVTAVVAGLISLRPGENQTRNAPPEVIVGVATVLSGDLSALGQNIVQTVETYRSCCLRHEIEFVFEDAKKSSSDGLAAYQSLIASKNVDVLLGGTTSNGTLAAKELINRSKTVLLTPLTGGSNIDQAGPYIFRLGNSDILNGKQQAELFIERQLTRVALFTEETEYTQDIAKSFRERFQQLGGDIVYDQVFLPDSNDFRSDIVRVKQAQPQALFMSTQSGLAFGLFVKQLRASGGLEFAEIHTNFLAAQNPDAMRVGGAAMNRVHFLKPSYDRASEKSREFFSRFAAEHGQAPTIAFHTAGTVDALDMLQQYLDTHPRFKREEFQRYLQEEIGNYRGLMGQFAFDSDGNSSLGFEPAIIN